VEHEKLINFCLNKIEKSEKQKHGNNNFVQEYIKMYPTAEYDKKELAFILRDLFVASSESVSISVAWALTILGNRREILERVQKEMDSVVPRDRFPSLYDKKNMPYFEATVLEVLRYRTVGPFSIPHMTTCDTSVEGFDIPKSTTVLVNLWSAHMDPLIWKDPDVFRPERFLDDKMNVINQDLMIAFSLGKRACPGETMARQEVFLFLSSILHQFDILPPEGQTSIREEMRPILVLSPAPYKLRLVPRCICQHLQSAF